MAMLECPGCKHIVDDSTKRCANCGYEVKKYFKQLAKDAKKNGKPLGTTSIQLSSIYDAEEDISSIELDFLKKPSAAAEPSPAPVVSAPIAQAEPAPALSSQSETPFSIPASAPVMPGAPLSVESVTPGTPVAPATPAEPVETQSIPASPVAATPASPIYQAPVSEPVKPASPVVPSLQDFLSGNAAPKAEPQPQAPVTPASTVSAAPSQNNNPLFAASAPAQSAQPVQKAPASNENPFMSMNPFGIQNNKPASPAPQTQAAVLPTSGMGSPAPQTQTAVLPTSGMGSSAPQTQAAVLPTAGPSVSTTGAPVPLGGGSVLPMSGGTGGSNVSHRSTLTMGNMPITSLGGAAGQAKVIAPAQAAPERKPIVPNEHSTIQKPVYSDEPANHVVTTTPPVVEQRSTMPNTSKPQQKAPAGMFDSDILNQAQAAGTRVESSATNATLADARRAEEKKREEQESYNPYLRKAANNMTLDQIPKFQQSKSANSPTAANPLLAGGGFGVGTGAAVIQHSSKVEKQEEEVITGIFDSPLLNAQAKKIADGEFVPTSVASQATLGDLERKRQQAVDYASYKSNLTGGKNFQNQIPENLIGKQKNESGIFANGSQPANPFLSNKNTTPPGGSNPFLGQ